MFLEELKNKIENNGAYGDEEDNDDTYDEDDNTLKYQYFTLNILPSLNRFLENNSDKTNEVLDVVESVISNEQNNSLSLYCSYSIFEILAKKDKNIINRILEVSKSALNHPNNDDQSYICFYNKLVHIATSYPDKLDDILNFYKTALKDTDNSSKTLSVLFECFTKFVYIDWDKQLDPDTLLDVYKIALENPNNDNYLVSSLSEEFENFEYLYEDELNHDALLDFYKTAVANTNNGGYSSELFYESFNQFQKRNKDELNPDVLLDFYKTALKNIVKSSLYESLHQFQERYKDNLDPNVLLDFYKTALKDTDNSETLSVLFKCFVNFADIYKDKLDPDALLDYYKNAIANTNNDGKSLSSFSKSFNQFQERYKDNLDPNALLDYYKTALANTNNGSYSLSSLFEHFINFADIYKNKRNSQDLLDFYKLAAIEHKNNQRFIYSDFYAGVRNFAKKYTDNIDPKDVLDIYKIAIKNTNFEDIDGIEEYVSNIYDSLANLINDNKNIAPQVLDTALQISNIKTKDSRNYDNYLIEIMALSYRKVDKKQISNFTDHQKHLFVIAYNMRYSRYEEIRYALNNYSKDEIKNINFSNISRSTALLMKEFTREQLKNSSSDDMKQALKNNYQNNSDWMIPASFNASAIFGSDLKSYLEKSRKFLSVHDRVYWLPRNMSEEKNKSFVIFINRHFIYNNDAGEKLCRPIKELSVISKNWYQLTPEEEQANYKGILSVCRSKKYSNPKYGDFAEEAARCGVYGDKRYHLCEDIYNSGLRVPTPFDCSRRYKTEKYTGRFLPRDDVRTGFFGDHTDCCQHFGGMGERCAVSSIKAPYSQLFVVEDKDGNIVAGSWVWVNTEGKYKDVCFDNIEALREYQNKAFINEIYENVAQDLIDNDDCHKITVGCGYQDASIDKYKETPVIPLPSHYKNNYSDAKDKQVLLAINKKAPEIDHSKESLRFIREMDMSDCHEIEQVCRRCYPEGDKTPGMPNEFSGLAIVDEHKGIVGYCLYDKEEKYITDMAVLPEYRTDKNASSKKLIVEMIRKVKEIGGEWFANARETTSLRYLKIMAARNIIDLNIHEVEREMSDGDKVYNVTFQVKSTNSNGKSLSADDEKQSSAYSSKPSNAPLER